MTKGCSRGVAPPSWVFGLVLLVARPSAAGSQEVAAGDTSASSAAPAVDHPAPATPPAEAAAPAPPERADDPLAGLELPVRPVRVERLDNGLTVAIEEDPTVHRVAVVLGVRVGSGDDPPGHQGLAHMTEHLMFQGSRNVPEDRFFRELELAGVTDANGTTSADDTLYFEVVPASRLAPVLWLEADRLASMLDHVDEATLEVQKRVVKSEWRLRGGRFLARVHRAVGEVLYPPGHPHRNAGDEPDDIDAFTLDDVRWFFQRHYRPDNVTLALVGGVDADEAMALVRRYFGTIRATHPPPPALPAAAAADPDALPGAAHLRARAPLFYDSVEYHWRTPPLLEEGDAALDLAATVLRRRLDAAFEEAGLRPRGVSVRQMSGVRASTFVIDLTGSVVLELDALAHVAEEVLDDFLDDPRPTEREMDDARRTWLRARFGAGESLVGRASFLAREVTRHDVRTTRLAVDLERYRVVGRDDVARVVRQYLTPRRRLRVDYRRDETADSEGSIEGREGFRWPG